MLRKLCPLCCDVQILASNNLLHLLSTFYFLAGSYDIDHSVSYYPIVSNVSPLHHLTLEFRFCSIDCDRATVHRYVGRGVIVKRVEHVNWKIGVQQWDLSHLGRHISLCESISLFPFFWTFLQGDCSPSIVHLLFYPLVQRNYPEFIRKLQFQSNFSLPFCLFY